MQLQSYLIGLGEISTFTFVCVSLPFYIAFILTLVKHRNDRELGVSFFKTAVVLGFCDLLFVVHHYIFWEAPHLNIFPQLVKAGGVPFSHYGFFMIFFARMGQAAGVVLMTTNRLVIVLKPITHDLIITNSRTIVAIVVIQVILPAIYSMTSLNCSLNIVTNTNGTDAQYSMDESCFGPIVTGIAFTFLATGLWVAFSYSVMIFKLFCNRSRVPGRNQGPQQGHIQRNITIVAAMISGLLVFNCFLMLQLCQPKEDHTNPACAMIRNATAMLFSMCSPYIFFAISAAVREKFIFTRCYHFQWIRGQAAGSSSGQTLHPEQQEELELREMK